MSRTDEVVDGIRRMIIDGELAAGDRLPIEKDLAAHLGVSRGSLREGVRALSVLGVLETRQGDGTYVTSLDPAVLLASIGFVVDLQGPASAQHFHSVRRVLETEAAGLTARRIDTAGLQAARDALDTAEQLLTQAPTDHERLMETDIAFHRALANHCGDPVLAAMIDALASKTLRARLWRALSEEGVEHRTHREHLGILHAVEQGDPESARIRMAAHLLEVQDYVRAAPTPTLD